MKKGVLKALTIYLVGFTIAWLIYSIYGHPYIHAPGFHHLIVFFTFLIAIFWTIGAILFFFLKKKSIALKSFIVTNLIFISCFSFYIYYSLVSENQNDPFDNEPKNEIISETKGDTTFVYHNGNVVYMKVKDSVLLDFLKDIKFEE